MKQQKLTVRPRIGIGRGHSRRIRAGGEVPAIIYGKRNEPQALAVNERVLGQLLKSIAGSAAVIEIEAEDCETRLSIIQEVQRNPITNQLLHLDLHEVDANEKMTVNVTVRTMGEAFGVLNEGGVMDLASHDIQIRCLPRDLPEFIEVDVEDLHVGQTLHIRELASIEGVEFLDDSERPVISCVHAAVAEEVDEVVEEETVEGEGGEAEVEEGEKEEG